MTVSRSANVSLNSFKLVPTLKNQVEYVPKNRADDLDNLDISVLETLEDMKRLYQVESAEERA